MTWGYTSENRTGNGTGRCLDVVERRQDGSYDYAILRYTGTPSEYLPVNLSRRPSPGDVLQIFSHPSGVPLASSGTCQLLGDFETGTQFAHDCDTLGGSSGAAVLNGAFEVVGTHAFGIESYDVNGATYMADIPVLRQINLGYRTR